MDLYLWDNPPITQLVQLRGPQPKHTSGVVQMFYKTTHWMDKEAPRSKLSFFQHSSH